MIRFFISLLIALFFGALLAYAVKEYDGYVRILLGSQLIEMKLTTAVIMLVLLIITLNLIVWAVKHLVGLTGNVGRWRSYKQRSKARNRTIRGMLYYAEGNWRRAQKQLTLAAGNSETPLVNYITAAQAANEQGDGAEADRLLQRASATTPGAEVAIGVTQAQLQIARGQNDEALDTLLRLRKKAPNHHSILKQLQQVYLAQQEWHKLNELLPELRKREVLNGTALTDLERSIWLAFLDDAAKEIAATDQPKDHIEKIHSVWDALPKNLRRDEVILEHYARSLDRFGYGNVAESLLRKFLRSDWNNKLIELYGLIEASQPEEQLLSAENWLKNRPNNEMLLLTLGRLCLRNKLWDKAEDYFKASVEAKPNKPAYAELCRLTARRGQHDKSADYYVRGLLDDDALPDLPMPEATLGLGAVAS